MISSFIDSLEIFGMTENALTYDSVKKQYRKLCLIHHPDKGGQEGMFIKVAAAYETLINYVETARADKREEPWEKQEESNDWGWYKERRRKPYQNHRKRHQDSIPNAGWRRYDGDWVVQVDEQHEKHTLVVVVARSGRVTYVRLDEYIDEDDYGYMYTYYTD